MRYAKNTTLSRMRWPFLLAALVCMTLPACNFDRSAKDSHRDHKTSSSQSAASAQNASDPGLNLNCVIERLQNPPDSFHYSYRKAATDSVVNTVDEQADVTPQEITGSFKNDNFSRTFHGVRSDSDSWQGGWSSLMGIVGMSGSVALVNHSSAMVREAKETMNGYDTVRYSIDTSRGDWAEEGLYKTTLGNGGFEKGVVWVNSQGCPVKFVLDSEMHLHDGGVAKVHYEEAMVKK